LVLILSERIISRVRFALKRIPVSLMLISFFLITCGKRKNIEEYEYTPPQIDWDEDDDLDDLPEEEEDTG